VKRKQDPKVHPPYDIITHLGDVMRVRKISFISNDPDEGNAKLYYVWVDDEESV